MKKNSFVEGTLIASLSLLFIKFLGAVYVIPFYNIVGTLGGALYSYAYSVYSLLVNICTSGLPIAISKIVSEYHTLEMYEAREKTLKIGNRFVLIISVISFCIMFIFAKQMAYLFIGNNTGGNTIADIELVIRSISFCLLIIPFLSIKKGYLQGQEYISVTTTSQVIEQVVRIAFLLIGSYLAINVFKLKVSIGVAIAVFSAFVGGLAAYIYIEVKYRKNKKLFVYKKGSIKDKVSNKTIFKKILKYSIPLIVISIAIDIYSMTDLALIIRGLSILGYSGAEAETIASVSCTWASKICIIVNAVTAGLSISLIPHMVSSLVKKDYDSVNSYFVKSIGIILVIGLPMSMGICLLSKELYTIFYGASEYGSIILKIQAFSVLYTNINYVIGVSLQSLDKYKTALLSTIVGLVINAILDVPLILLCSKIGIYPYYGATISTIIGTTVSLIISMRVLKKTINFRYKGILNILKKLILPLVLMSVIVFGLEYLLYGVFNTRMTMIITSLICAFVGAAIYIFITYKNNILYDVLGKDYVDNVLIKLHLKKAK